MRVESILSRSPSTPLEEEVRRSAHTTLALIIKPFCSTSYSDPTVEEKKGPKGILREREGEKEANKARRRKGKKGGGRGNYTATDAPAGRQIVIHNENMCPFFDLIGHVDNMWGTRTRKLM